MGDRRPGRRSRGGRGPRWAVAAFLVVAAGFLVWALAGRWEELRALRSQVEGFPWRWDGGLLSAALGLAAAALLATAAIWVRLLRALGEPVSYRRGILAWAVASLGRYIPGKVWQLSGLAVLLKREGRSGAAAVTSNVVAQVLTLLTGAGVGLALGAGGRIGGPAGAGLRAGALLVLLAALLHPAVVRRLTRWAAGRLGEQVSPESFGAGELLRAGAALLAVWGAHGLAFRLFLGGTVGEAAPGLAAATGIFAASYVAGFLVIVAPGGLVAREGAMTALLASLGGLPVGVAAALALAARVWTTAAELLALGLAAAADRWT